MRMPAPSRLALLIIVAAACLANGCGRGDDGVRPVYDRNTAFVLVSQEIPPGLQDYYLFNLDRRAPDADGVEALRNGLRRAQKRSQYVGVIGPDPERNRAVLESALPDDPATGLAKVTLIYVGPAAQEDAIRALVAPYDADLRYVSYP